MVPRTASSEHYSSWSSNYVNNSRRSHTQLRAPSSARQSNIHSRRCSTHVYVWSIFLEVTRGYKVYSALFCSPKLCYQRVLDYHIMSSTCERHDTTIFFAFSPKLYEILVRVRKTLVLYLSMRGNHQKKKNSTVG